MIKKELVFVFLVSFSLFANQDNNKNYIFTEGTGKISVKPDYVITKLGVSTINHDADSALKINNCILDSLLNTLKQFNVMETDIETYSSAFVREYKDNRDTTTFLGIKSESILKVKFYELENLEKLLNTLISKGMNVLKTYEFKHTKEDSLKRIAAQLAFDEAKQNAIAITMKSNRNLGKLLNVSYEKPNNYRVRPDFKIELSRELVLSKMGSLRGDLDLKQKQDLKYLRILIPSIEFVNDVYTKFELK